MIRLIGCDERIPNWDRLNAITSRLAAKDSTIWGEKARAEASIRLGWIDLPENSRQLLPALDALVAWSRELGHEHFILCGMGGSSLAPEVMAKSYRKELVVLDSTDPQQVLAATPVDLSRTCIIIGSKSGSTIETASQRAYFTSALQKSGLDPKNHLVVVTDPGSPFDLSARSEGLRTINADPHVGGRFSALSAFGLVPAALIGIDVSVLLDDALAATEEFTAPDSSVVRMASLLSTEKYLYVGFYDSDSDVPGLSDWIEQLIAESTGKDGRGILPIVANRKESPLYPTIGFSNTSRTSVIGPLGSQFIFWEWVTALLGFLIDVDPFNQPNVSESKERTGALLDAWSNGSFELSRPTFSTSECEVFGSQQCSSLEELFASLRNKRSGYVAVMAYLSRESDEEIVEILPLLESKLSLPTTFGWGPRFLHSTGQFHKGGPLVGTFIQITTSDSEKVSIPGSPYGFETLLLAQALGDNQALSSRDLKVVRINIKNRKRGVKEILDAVRSL